MRERGPEAVSAKVRTSVRELLWSLAGRSGAGPIATSVLHRRRSLRVLMYHDVPAPLIGTFESHLKWLVTKFEFVAPADLLAAAAASTRPKALLTFDDGCSDNYELVAPLLETYGLRGLFFVCPGFAGLSREDSFALMERASLLRQEKGRDSRWQRMSREQIVELDRRGHGIGSHTLTHVPLATVGHEQMSREIEDSAAVLESWLAHPCWFFAWTYSWDAINREGLNVASKRHRFCFSPCSGLNRWPQPDRLLWRTGVDVSMPVSHLQTQLSGIIDFSYRRARRQLMELWGSATSRPSK